MEDHLKHVKTSDGKFVVVDKDGKARAEFDNRKDAEAYAKSKLKDLNHIDESGAGEEGTNKLTQKYKKDTPGELEEAGISGYGGGTNTNFDTDDENDQKYFQQTRGSRKKMYPGLWGAVARVKARSLKSMADLEKHKSGEAPENLVADVRNLLKKTDSLLRRLKTSRGLKESAEYQGRKVTLDDPFRADDGKHKFYVYVKNEKGNVIKLGFGDPNMEIKRDDPGARKGFRARHNCEDPGPKWKARYWSCKMWEKGKSVSDVLGD